MSTLLSRLVSFAQIFLSTCVIPVHSKLTLLFCLIFTLNLPIIDVIEKINSPIMSQKDTTDYYSGMSLQVCHCGWSKVTTYQGLRIHQGKMGCTPKKTRSPKTEECDWNNQGEEVGQRKHQPAKRTTVKKEVYILEGYCIWATSQSSVRKVIFLAVLDHYCVKQYQSTLNFPP